MRFDKMLLSELRTIESKNTSKVNLEKYREIFLSGDIFNSEYIPRTMSAVVDSENLKALGYTLSDEGFVRLMADYEANPGMKPLYKRVSEMEPEIKVSPMYPNFPIQVLEMDELEYRVNQVIHYFTTYGVESILDVEVEKGWLPETEVVEEREVDKRVVALKMVDYLTSEEVDRKVINGLIGRKQRLEAKELEIAKFVAMRTPLTIEEVPFKENIGKLFADVVLAGSLEERQKVFSLLSTIMKHPGDVLDFVEELVVINKYKHFPTSVKRGFVELIEQFSKDAIEENLASNRWSKRFRGKNGKPRSINRNVALIDYLSFNRFSKNADAKKVVEDLKNGALVSWNQNLELAYSEENFEEVVRLLKQRPGIFFRQVNRLIKRGVAGEVISRELSALAGQLKTQTIVSALNNFDGNIEVDKAFFSVLVANLKAKEVAELKNKKVFIDSSDIDFSRSKLEITERSEEGGYIQSGMAIRIPDDVKFLRFFTYWNDERRIDIDLHAVAGGADGRRTHVGWNGDYNRSGVVHSGDITHSNAAEYIDMDIEAALKTGHDRVQFNINSFTGVPFSEIDTVFTGLMGLSSKGEKVELYDAKNVFFRHDLKSKFTSMDYGMVDLEGRVMYIAGKLADGRNDTNLFELPNHKLTIESYLRLLLVGQGAEIVADREKSDIILGLTKSDDEKFVSLIDNNFFMG